MFSEFLPVEGTGKREYIMKQVHDCVVDMKVSRFGADPYLNGEGAFETITGIQSQGVQGMLLSTKGLSRGLMLVAPAAAKHYINNEQEHFRESSSIVVDDRYVSDIYPNIAAIT